MKNKVWIEIMSEGTTYDCKPTVEDVVECIMEEYRRSDVCLAELLENIQVRGLNLVDTVQVYAKLFVKVENDKVLRLTEEGDTFDLAENPGRPKSTITELIQTQLRVTPELFEIGECRDPKALTEFLENMSPCCLARPTFMATNPNELVNRFIDALKK